MTCTPEKGQASRGTDTGVVFHPTEDGVGDGSGLGPVSVDPGTSSPSSVPTEDLGLRTGANPDKNPRRDDLGSSSTPCRGTGPTTFRSRRTSVSGWDLTRQRPRVCVAGPFPVDPDVTRPVPDRRDQHPRGPRESPNPERGPSFHPSRPYWAPRTPTRWFNEDSAEAKTGPTDNYYRDKIKVRPI